MKTRAVPLSLRLFTLGTLLSVMCAVPSASDAAVSAGGLVVVGYTDNNYDNGSGPSDDVIALLATETIDVGEEIYLTNNGWINNGDQGFEGAKLGDGGYRGAGAAQITKLTITSTIFAGTVITTNATGPGLGYQWTTSGQIVPNAIYEQNTFSALDLQHDKTYPPHIGDQIYIFQSDSFLLSDQITSHVAGVNPLLNPSNFIHALHMGNENYQTFSSSYTGGASGGALPFDSTGMVEVSEFADGTFVHSVQGLDLGSDDFDDSNDFSAFELDYLSEFFEGTYQINFMAQDIIDLNATGGTKEQWLVALSSSSNWYKAGPSGDPNFTTGFNILGVPEPSRALLVFIGSMSIMFRRRRSS